MASPRAIRWFFGEEPLLSPAAPRLRLAAAVESESAASTLPAEVLAAILASLWRMDHLAPRLAHVSKTFAAANVMAAIDVADVDVVEKAETEAIRMNGHSNNAAARLTICCTSQSVC